MQFGCPLKKNVNVFIKKLFTAIAWPRTIGEWTKERKREMGEQTKYND